MKDSSSPLQQQNQIRRYYHQGQMNNNSPRMNNNNNNNNDQDQQQNDDIFMNRNEARSPQSQQMNYSPNKVQKRAVYRQRGTSYDNFTKEVSQLQNRNKINQNILDSSVINNNNNNNDQDIYSHRNSVNPNQNNVIRKLDFQQQNGKNDKNNNGIITNNNIRAQSYDKVRSLRTSHGNVSFSNQQQQQSPPLLKNIQTSPQNNNRNNSVNNNNNNNNNNNLRIGLKDQQQQQQQENKDRRYSSQNSTYYNQQNNSSPRHSETSFAPSHVPCFSLDYSFLDDISPNDPRLIRLLNDDVINNKTIDVAKLLDQNPDYFHHMFRNCACFQCTCGLCKCEHSNLKLTYKPGFNTVYRKNYNKKDFDKTPSINQTHYNSLGLHNPDNLNPLLQTNYMSDYVPWKVQKQSPQKEKYKQNGNPFFALTTYNSNFKDWQNYDPSNKAVKPLDKHIFGLPFSNSTTYKDNFNFKDNANPVTARDIKASLQGSPLLKGYEPQHNTEYNQSYIGKNPYDNRSPNKPDNSRISPIPSFVDQYRSTFMNDFNDKRRNNECPVKTSKYATKPWKLKLLTKINQFRNTKNSDDLYQSYQDGKTSRLNNSNY